MEPSTSTDFGGPLLTVQQAAERHPAVTQRRVRHWIAKSRPRYQWVNRVKTEIPGNGFDSVYRKVGRSVLLFEGRLLRWVDSQ